MGRDSDHRGAQGKNARTDSTSRIDRVLRSPRRPRTPIFVGFEAEPNSRSDGVPEIWGCDDRMEERTPSRSAAERDLSDLIVRDAEVALAGLLTVGVRPQESEPLHPIAISAQERWAISGPPKRSAVLAMLVRRIARTVLRKTVGMAARQRRDRENDRPIVQASG
jgi:hypothetical protein